MPSRSSRFSPTMSNARMAPVSASSTRPHGSTLAARGVSPELARRLMVQAFLGDALVALDDDETRETLMQIALDKVDKAL